MSGTRFARSGRCRFFVCLGVFIIMVLFVAIFHSSQLQLDESREQRLRCEQQQEGLNEQLQTVVEQKFNLEKAHERELSQQMETRRSLEQQLKDANDLLSKEQLKSHERYEKLQQTFKLLQVKHDELEAECAKSKKQHLEDTNAFEQKLQALRSETQKSKSMQAGEISAWKEKHNALLQEKEHLEQVLNTKDTNTRILSLESIIEEYKQHCVYKPKTRKDTEQQQLNKPLNAPETTRNSSRQPHSIDKPRNEKSFNEQVQMVPKYQMSKVDNEEKERQRQEQQQAEAVGAAPEVAALVADKSISPLGPPRKPTATQSSKSVNDGHLKQASSATASSAATPSSSGSALPPLAVPPKVKHLPDMVAPIPENFEQLAVPSNKLFDPADIDAAAEDLAKNDNEDGKNNRYANVVKEMEGKQQKPNGVGGGGVNEDSGAHEVKDHDHDFINDGNFNLPADENNHFFDGADNKHVAAEKLPADGDHDNDDDDLMGNVGDGDGDVAVKQPQHLLDADNLNIEIAGDQGKEFADGLRMDDGNEEDQDEDDYSNLAARKQGAEAIRN